MAAEQEKHYYFVTWLWYDTVNDFPVPKYVNSLYWTHNEGLSPRQWVIGKRNRIPSAVYINGEKICLAEYLSLMDLLPKE